MDNTISRVLAHVYDLEGLLLVMERRGDETPRLVLDRIREKARELNDEVQMLHLPESPVVAAPEVPVRPVEAPAPPARSASSLPSDDYDADDTWQHDNGDDSSAAFALNYTEPVRRIQEPEPELPVVEAMRVEEKLQRSLRQDLRRAFSINDRYRFRRELFSNSDVEMNDALNLIESMQSMDEAEDYFYGEMGWDRENPEVDDFMTIVRHHFNE
ncbi:MAG: hypothetical protein II519_08350 [Muribaculaceae bacterium]|nr:hypothetical protein [Muribaculaceae bacterium]